MLHFKDQAFSNGPIAFGCMSLREQSSDVRKMIQKALGEGISFFDTADIYGDGLNESILGEALRISRHEAFIATKVGNLRQPDGSLKWAPSKSYIFQAVEKSLTRLKTDYIDLYQLHGGTIQDPIDEIVEAFEKLKSQGKIRFYGISSIRPNVIKAYGERGGISSVMMQYSLLDRRPEEEILSYLINHQIPVIVRGAIAGGLLTGSKSAATYLQFTPTEVEKASRVIEIIAQELDMSPLETALSYVYSCSTVSLIALGIRTEAQLDQAILAQKRVCKLDTERLSRMRAQVRAICYDAHR